MPAAQYTVTIRRPAEDVFAFVADGTTGPRWRSGVEDIALVSGSGLGAKYRQAMRGPGGRRIEADYEIVGYEPPRHLAFQVVAGPVRPHGDYRFEPTPEGTRVTFSLGVELSGIKRLVLARSVQREMDSGVQSLERLKELLES